MSRWLALVAVLFVVVGVRADDKWVTLKGQVVIDGTFPAPPEIKVTSDADHCLEKGKLFGETWVVNPKNQGVRYAFVWLASDATTASGKGLPVHPSLKEIKEKTVEMDQPMCAFVPHAVAIREGQHLVVKNSSPKSHSVRWQGQLKNPGANPVIPSGQAVTIDNLKAERFPVRISCSVHPWMSALAAVFDHPYFAVTDADGKFEIKLAPVGTYRLFTYHEGCGWRNGSKGKNGEEITIKPGDVQDLGKLALTAPKD